MAKYTIRVPIDVEAIQFTNDHAVGKSALPDWIDAPWDEFNKNKSRFSFSHLDLEFYISTIGNEYTKVNYSDYIVKTGNKISVVKAEIFESIYREAKL